MTGRIFVATYGVPQPTRDSGSKRLSDLIRLLREDAWEVAFVAASGIHSEIDARRLERLGVPVHDGRGPALEELVATGGFDVALFAFWQVAELIAPLFRLRSPSTRIVVDSVDAQFVRDARRVFQRNGNGGPPSLLDDDYARETISELNVYAAADTVLTVSDDEAALISSLTNEPGLARCVPDCEELDTRPRGFDERHGLLFVGSFRHPPNGDAVRFACREVLPLIDPALREAHPLYVVGDGLDDTVRGYAAGLDHVRMVGWVPSLVPYYEQARVVIVPLRYGAGTKRKLIQALTAGTPTVSTSVGVEGLDVEHDRHVLVADDAASFAAEVERLLSDRPLWERLAAARGHIGRRHSVEAVRGSLSAALEAALARTPKTGLLPQGTRGRFERRMLYQAAQKAVPRIEEALDENVPADATLVVLNRGLTELLRLGERRAWPFPEALDGAAGAPFPADPLEGVAGIDALAARGAEVLVLPAIASWWDERVQALIPHLRERFRQIASTDSCELYDLRRRAAVASGAGGDGPDLRVVGGSPGAPAGPGVRLLAFYLPQFHPIPENDAWWGEGFTEWQNVTRARPLFEGHYQPRLPADLGFYDLRLAESREAQAALAREYGISGFCYYHYWFSGKRLLQRPFDEVLASGRPDFPFCLCWANEPWSRRWDGQDQDVLQPQAYSEEDDRRHIAWLMPALLDPRAIRVGGKPLFLVYQSHVLPDPARTVEIWQAAAREAGLPGLHLVAVETGWDAGRDATAAGFDAKVLFQPQFSILATVPRLELGPLETRVFDYRQAWPALAAPEPVPYRRYECVCPSWDNSPRRGEDAWVLHDSTPEAYEEWLALAIGRTLELPPEERLVFLNAWNEWAEGAHLEPDSRHGRAYLEATLRARRSVCGEAAVPEPERAAS